MGESRIQTTNCNQAAMKGKQTHLQTASSSGPPERCSKISSGLQAPKPEPKHLVNEQPSSCVENVNDNVLLRDFSTEATAGSLSDRKSDVESNFLNTDTNKRKQELSSYNVTLSHESGDTNTSADIVNLQANEIAKYSKGTVKNYLHKEIMSVTDMLEHTNIQKSDKKNVIPSSDISVDAVVFDSGVSYTESVGGKAGDKGEGHSVEVMEDEAVTVKDEELPAKYQYTAFYDAAFIHSGDPSDMEVADTLCEEMEKEVTLKNGDKPRLYLKERDKHLGRSRLDESGNAVSNSTYKFVILSPKLTEDKWSNMLKDEAIMTAIENEDLQWSVIPIHTGKKGDYEIPFGLKALNAIELTSRGRFFYKNLANVFDKKLYVREDREKIFFKEKEKVREVVRRGKEREIRDRRHRELMEQRRIECERKNEFAAYKKDEREVSINF